MSERTSFARGDGHDVPIGELGRERISTMDLLATLQLSLVAERPRDTSLSYKVIGLED